MPIRCRNYDDDGKPIGRGCSKGSECAFAHPSNPGEWGRAFRKGNAGRQHSGSFSSGGHTRRTSGTWGDRDNAYTTSTNMTKLPEMGKKWGTSTGADKAQAESSSTGWGATGGADSTSATNYPGKKTQPAVWNLEAPAWGDKSGGGGWSSSGDDWKYSDGGGGWGTTEDTGTSAWGATADAGTSSWGKTADTGTSAWGKTVDAGISAWGKAVDSETSAWAIADSETSALETTPAKIDKAAASRFVKHAMAQGHTAYPGASTWGAGNGASQKDDNGKGKEKEDVTMRDPPPPSARRSLAYPDRHESQSKKPDPPRIRTDGQPSQSHSPFQSPLPSPLTARPTNSMPLPRKQSKARLPSADNLKKVALELAASKAVLETGKIYPQDNPDTQSQSLAPPDPKKYTGPKGRLALFSDILSHMQDLVISEVFLQRAQYDVERWKSTQNSEIYGHATLLTRMILNSLGKEYRGKVTGAKESRDNALRALASLPDFSSKDKITTPKITKETVASYTRELRDWLQGLEAHKVLLIEAQEEKSKPPEPDSGDVEMETQPAQLTAKELLERGNWTWRELKDAMAGLGTHIDTISEPVYAEKYINFPEVEGKLQEVAEASMEVEDDVDRGSQAQDADNLVRGINRVGEDLGAQVVRAVTLINKVDELERELEIVVAEKNKMDALCAEAEKQFEVFEQSKKAHAAEIQDLTEKIQKLHLHKRPSTRPSSSPPPVKIDEIIEYVRPIVLTRMEADMAPFFERLRAGCKENQAEVAKELEELVKPVVDMTEAICKLAGASAHASAQSQ